MLRRGSIAARDQWQELRTTHGVPYWQNIKTNALSATKPASMKARDLTGAGEWAWLQDEQEGYIPVHRTKRDGTKWQVQLDGGEVRFSPTVCSPRRGALP